MVLLSHPTGNANVREAARALNESGLLAEFWTSVCWRKGHPLTRFLPGGVARELERRSFPHVPQDRIRCNPWREAGRLAGNRFGLKWSPFSVEAVYRSLDARIAARLRRRPDIDAVYGYDAGALASFREAKRLGVKRIYELPIGHWKAYKELMTEESALQPEWAGSIQGNLQSGDRLERQDEELSLATNIIVPSAFVQQTLSHSIHRDVHVSVVPYGTPPVRWEESEKPSRDGELRVIFVGALTQRKGLSYLVNAVERFGPKVKLTMIGRKIGECAAVDRAVKTHRWIPTLPHPAVLEEMRHHDVMVFPSLFEGMSLSLLEGMAHGLPLITTASTGALDYVSEGEDGFIVPIRSVDAIVEKLELLLRDRERLQAMRAAALRKAAVHSWEHYRLRLTTVVREALEERVPSEGPVAGDALGWYSNARVS